jgi:hypothetical protein
MVRGLQAREPARGMLEVLEGRSRAARWTAPAGAEGKRRCGRLPFPADPRAMWTYVLRYRLLLRAIYARSTAA